MKPFWLRHRDYRFLVPQILHRPAQGPKARWQTGKTEGKEFLRLIKKKFYPVARHNQFVDPLAWNEGGLWAQKPADDPTPWKHVGVNCHIEEGLSAILVDLCV